MQDFSRLEQTSIPSRVIDYDEPEPQTECMICGEKFEEDCHHVCPKCRAKYSTMKNAIEFGSDESSKTKVAINGFLATVFTPEQIDEILAREYVSAGEDHEAQENYCVHPSCDDEFADFICDKLKEEE